MAALVGGGSVDDTPGLVPPHSLQDTMRVRQCIADGDELKNAMLC